MKNHLSHPQLYPKPTLTLQRPRTLFPIPCWLILVTVLLGPTLGMSFVWGAEMHDDGIVAPYVPPKEHREYVAHLDPALLRTLKVDPAMIDQWQDDRFGLLIQH